MTTEPDPADLTDVPSAADYKRAFLATRAALSGKKFLEILQAHYRAPDHSISAGDLAEAVGLQDYNAVNLQYGKYSRALCEALNREPKIPLAILMTFGGGSQKSDEIRYTLLPQVVAALEELRWVQRPSQVPE